MENEIGMKAVIKIIQIATSIGKAGIDFVEGEKQCREEMENFETQIRQDQKEKIISKLTSDNILSKTALSFVKKAIMEADK